MDFIDFAQGDKKQDRFFRFLRRSTIELLPYMAGEDGIRTHNFRLGMLIKIAVYAFIYLIIYYIKKFL